MDLNWCPCIAMCTFGNLRFLLTYVVFASFVFSLDGSFDHRGGDFGMAVVCKWYVVSSESNRGAFISLNPVAI